MALAEGSSLVSRTNMERIRSSCTSSCGDPKPSSDSTRPALMDTYPYTHVFKNKIHHLNIPKGASLSFSLLAFVTSFGQRTGLSVSGPFVFNCHRFPQVRDVHIPYIENPTCIICKGKDISREEGLLRLCFLLPWQ